MNQKLAQKLRNRLRDKINNEDLEGVRATVREMLAGGADLDGSFKGPWGNTALCRAAYLGHVPIIEHLLDSGAQINYPDVEDCLPMRYAIEGQQLDAVQLLIGRGADLNVLSDPKRWSHTPLHSAIFGVADTGSSKKPQIVVMLLDAGADPFHRPENGASFYQPPFQYAVEHANIAAINEIADRYVIDFKQKNYAGKTLFDLPNDLNRDKVRSVLNAIKTEQAVRAAITAPATPTGQTTRGTLAPI